jgi:hypothetical protein
MNDTMVIDTLKIFERLKRANLAETAARELSEVFRDHFVLQEEVLATKADLATMESRVKADIIKWVAGMLVAQTGLIAALVKLL